MTIEQIKSYLKSNKITYQTLSEKSGIPLGTLKNIFSQCAINPRIDTVQAIEEALGLTNRFEWTEEEKKLGIGRRAAYLSEDEWEWLELRSEIIEARGEQYLNTLSGLIRTLSKK